MHLPSLRQIPRFLSGLVNPVLASRRLRKFLSGINDLAREDQRRAPLPVLPDGEILISFVVPVYNTKPRYLDDLLASFHRQASLRCQLIFVDDGSTSGETLRWLARHQGAKDVDIVINPVNGGIAAATNTGIQRAVGRWIGLVDHDDVLADFAVDRVARALSENPDCQFLYTDEVIVDGKLRPLDIFFKPAWDPVLLSGVNYINHLSLYRRERLLSIGCLRDGFQGSQDYDLVLRYTEGLPCGTILHLPYPAYLWRRDGSSLSATDMGGATAAARRALAEHYGSGDSSCHVESSPLAHGLHRLRFDAVRKEWPSVSIVIPSFEGFVLISQLLEGLMSNTDYPSFDITIIDNGSTSLEIAALYEKARQGRIPFRALIHPEAFNFSRAVNRGIAETQGELVLLLNNDITILDDGWLKEMVSCLDYPGTGIVGARLLYPDRTLQHAGVIVGLGGLAGHWFGGADENFPGPMARLAVRQRFSAVTGACMLISRGCLDKTGLFDEVSFAIAYNDIDYCLRAGKAGFSVVWTPFATLLHHESATRGSDMTPENIDRFRREQECLRERHGTDTFTDPAYNPWLSRNTSSASPSPLMRLPCAR